MALTRLDRPLLKNSPTTRGYSLSRWDGKPVALVDLAEYMRGAGMNPNDAEAAAYVRQTLTAGGGTIILDDDAAARARFEAEQREKAARGARYGT